MNWVLVRFDLMPAIFSKRGRFVLLGFRGSVEFNDGVRGGAVCRLGLIGLGRRSI